MQKYFKRFWAGASLQEQLATDLRIEFPGVGGFSRRSVFYMQEFYIARRDLPKVQPLVAQIRWTQNLIVLQACKRQADETSWGKAVVERLAADLRAEFPGIQGFSSQNLWYMRQFYLAYYGHEKLQPLVGEISWAKRLVILGKCKDPLEREFYIRMTRKFGWTKNVLIH